MKNVRQKIYNKLTFLLSAVVIRTTALKLRKTFDSEDHDMQTE